MKRRRSILGNSGFASSTVTGIAGAISGADAGFDELRNRFDYAYQASVTIGPNNGATVFAGSPGIDVNANLRGHFLYGTFNTGSGSFRPAVRNDVNFGILAQAPSAISTNTGAIGRAVATLDLAAAARNVNLSWRFQIPPGWPSRLPPLP